MATGFSRYYFVSRFIFTVPMLVNFLSQLMQLFNNIYMLYKRFGVVNLQLRSTYHKIYMDKNIKKKTYKNSIQAMNENLTILTNNQRQTSITCIRILSCILQLWTMLRRRNWMICWD